MTLLLQLLGCLTGALAVNFVLFERITRRSLAISAAIVAILVVGALGLKELWPEHTINAAERHRALSKKEASAAGAVKLKINADFVEWVVAQTPESACFHLIARNRAVRQWVAYRMLPRLGSNAPRPGCWVIFYAVTPKTADVPVARVTDVREYGPKFSIARLQGAIGSR